MNRILTQQQKADLRQSFSQPGFSAEAAILKLVNEGYDVAEAKALIVAEFKEYKKELFEKAQKRNDSEEARKILFVAVFMLSIIGPVFDITSPLWYVAAFVASGVAGYYAYKEKPIAGIAGSILFAILFPFTYHFYFAGRSSYIRIEMLVPIFMAITPAFIIYFIISKTVYANIETN
jgi:hypothetical protein